MFYYLARRMFNYAIMLFVATSLGYLMAAYFLDPRLLWDINDVHLNRDALMASLTAKNLNPEVPLLDRYVVWLKDVFIHWDWGKTPRGESINTLLSNRIWVSARFILLGSLIGMFGGVAIGAYTATRQYKASDRVATFMSLLLISTPAMVTITIVQLLAIKFNQTTGLDFFKVVGAHSDVLPKYPGAYYVDTFMHLLLPTFTMSLGGIASYSRYQRNMMLDTLGADYVRTARAKGLPKSKAVFKHALRTSLVPMATFFAFAVAGLFLGATFTEQLFNWNGLGIYSVTSIQQYDVNGTVAVVAFSGLVTLTGALLSDILTVVVDPRVRVN